VELDRNLGGGLGEWKCEGRFESGPVEERDPETGEPRETWMEGWAALAPKLYRYRDPGKRAAVVRAKGMSKLTAIGMRALEGGAPHVVDTGVQSFLSAARGGGGLFRRSALSRSYLGDGAHFGGRLIGPDGTTRAQSYERILTPDTETVSSGAGA